MKLIDKIKNRQARVSVIGLGYVGFPLAVEFAKAGFQVLGVDLSPGKIKVINHGGSHIPDVDPDEVFPLVKAGKLSATDDFSVLAEADAMIICVPTPLNKTKNPDVSYILSATNKSRNISAQGNWWSWKAPPTQAPHGT